EELLRHVHARDDHAGDVPLLDLVVDPGEGDRELVGGEGDVGEVRVDPRHLLGIQVDVELAVLGLLVHCPTILLAWSRPSRSAASATRSARCSGCSCSGRSRSTRWWTNRGCSRSTGRWSRAPSPVSTRCRRTTRRGSSRSFSCSRGSLSLPTS